jgi:hypothetical protein
MNGNRLSALLIIGALAVLAWFSLYLGRFRIYQVDECQNIYMARVLATGQGVELFTNSSLFLLGPLSWLAKKATQSAELIANARLLFVGIFWLNLVLMAVIVRGTFNGLRSLIALAAAATLAPLWDYGFEIRHDNVVLTGILLTWWAVRVRPMQTLSYVIAGAATITLLFTAVKTVVYAVPLSFAILAFPPPAYKRPRLQLGLLWLGGALLALVAIRLCYGSGSAWDNYLSVFRGVTSYSASTGTTTRFWPGSTLSRLLDQTPLLLALTLAAGAAIARELWQRRWAAFTWNGNLPELLLLLGALTALLINPTFPYNLLHVVPYAFILAFKYGESVWNELRSRSQFWPLIGTVIVFVHLVPFAFASIRHLDKPNTRQNKLMNLAEALTHPANDRVYDGIGMVPTRRSIHFQWYIHSLNIRGMVKSPGLRVREMLAAQPAAVFIPSYRTNWLPPEDHEFIQANYVPLADDFWVLGSVLPITGGKFDVIHPGRYCIVSVPLEQPPSGALTIDTGKAVVGSLDGKPISAAPIDLGLGSHQIETTSDYRVAVVWIGPTLSELPRLEPSSLRTLFVNWY